MAPELAAELLDRLEEFGLLDDAAFAEGFVNSRRTRKGRIALSRELRSKGVAEEIIDETLAPLDDAAQLETAVELLERNAWRFEGVDRRRNRARAFAFLARRGFPAGVAADALERADLPGTRGP